MKFLIRRIRYAFAGHLMRGIFAIFSLLLVTGFVVLMLSGVINQRTLAEKIFGFAWHSSESIAEQVENGESPIELTDQGVYFKDSAPNGSSTIDVPIGKSSEGSEGSNGNEESSSESKDSSNGSESK